MKRRIINIGLCTVMMLIFTLLFGYLHSVFNQLHAMDLYHNSARDIGTEITAVDVDESNADPEDVMIAEYTSDYISKELSENGILNSVDIDYDNRTIVCRMLKDGVAQAVQDDNEEEWDETCETACSCSEAWKNRIRKAGLDGWHCSIVILNDYYPKKALATFKDGKAVYNCTKELATKLS